MSKGERQKAGLSVVSVDTIMSDLELELAVDLDTQGGVSIKEMGVGLYCERL